MYIAIEKYHGVVGVVGVPQDVLTPIQITVNIEQIIMQVFLKRGFTSFFYL